MKLALVFDTCFYKYEGGYYSTNFTSSLWKKRYLPYFDEIVVVSRYKESVEDVRERLVRSDMDNVEFRAIENKARLTRVFSLNKEEAFIEKAISDCDAVICRSWWGVRACKKLNKKYMIEVISCAWDQMWNHSFLGKLIAVPYFLKQRVAIRNAPNVIYVTNEFLQKRYPTGGNSIGVSDVVLKEKNDMSVLESRLEKQRCSKDNYILGTAAAVNVRYKGQKYVIKALALLKRQGISNFKYQMAGGGDQSRLKKIAKRYGVLDQVEFLGSISHDRIFDWLDSLDIYIQPSLQEGLPRAVVEAMSRALPCICTETGGMPELIENEFICTRSGFIYKHLADKLKYICRDECMKKASKYNFEKAKLFEENALYIKRDMFMRSFARK